MASGPIISWQIEGGKDETVTDFFFMGSKITVDRGATMKLKGACSWEGKLCKHTQHIKKQRQHFASPAFPIVMYGCENWTIKLSTKELMLLNCGVGEDS